jgi:hypothetical protein
MVLAVLVSIFFLRATLSKTLGIQNAIYIAAFINFIQIQVFNIVTMHIFSKKIKKFAFFDLDLFQSCCMAGQLW